MKIFLTGGSGFIGRALVQTLLAEGHQLTLLSRNPLKTQQLFQHTELLTTVASLDNYSNFNNYDAVINLAGEPIFDKRWTKQQKEHLQQSRVNLTTTLSQLINQSTIPPKTFISASAAGYYGNQPHLVLNEQSKKGKGFTTTLCEAWEKAALQTKNSRVCLIRMGIVLGKGGALAAMLPLYRYCLGGKLGTGEQYWAWISIIDVVNGLLFLLKQPHCQGVFNFCSPNPTQNQEINTLLSQLLCRPAWGKVPAGILRFFLGERACLLLDDQYLLPQHLLDCGFKFQYPEIKQALTIALDEFTPKNS
ncbi:TIGR01777 family protein [Mergibacter septicus]|uniref:TIGR01777 family oxidoreductase n=1 Tax=Mergibacter septicus TaxID=221402 RepID=UPI0011790CEB|nr:TIGR01777 family oxidoreductase [Mergibacter septicus]AWX13341.1 TIGR01777 family protein [Mergibacter septicus]